jgi:hypothetical protein
MSTFVVTIAVIGAIVWLNVTDIRHRRSLTPAQREAEDAESRAEMSIW